MIINVGQNDNHIRKSKEFQECVTRLANRHNILEIDPPNQVMATTIDGYLTNWGCEQLVKQLNQYGCSSIVPKRQHLIIRGG